ncbi:unnamed protein product [Phytomonas sp. EM1]|nr:unnamed protein product [Phytomonas sp. EM1]|eukprot:CCW60461.1 unnamed protein product [Phytomonas sp. isolate EM1]
MGKLDLEKEKQMELAAIWGSEVDGDVRYPKRRGATKKVMRTEAISESDPNNEDVLSDVGSDGEGASTNKGNAKQKKNIKKDAKKEYRLHCFVEPGTSKNAVRTVFDAYQPKVELRITQKGNLLNKSQYAVLTFRNKAMALHAVKMLDGTNQRDMLGVEKLKLNLMLNRHQSSIVRKKRNKLLKQYQNEKITKEVLNDMQFIEQFISQHIPQS